MARSPSQSRALLSRTSFSQTLSFYQVISGGSGSFSLKKKFSEKPFLVIVDANSMEQLNDAEIKILKGAKKKSRSGDYSLMELDVSFFTQTQESESFDTLLFEKSHFNLSKQRPLDVVLDSYTEAIKVIIESEMPISAKEKIQYEF